MRNRLFLLLAIVALYLLTSLGLNAIYGPSYPFLSGEDCWLPDGNGGWRAHGSPADPAPSEPSVNVPLLFNYLPIFIPAILLVLFLFTPLRRKLDPAVKKSDSEDDVGEPPAPSDQFK